MLIPPSREKVVAVGPRIGLALAGGGPLGGIYEMGALQALSEALEGADLNDLKVYVGVSAGAFMAASLANKITPAEMIGIFINNDNPEHPITPEVFLQPAFVEYLRRVTSIPLLMVKSFQRFFTSPLNFSLLESLSSLAQAIPTGIFNNERIHVVLSQIYNHGNRTNDFRQLKNKLFLIATDLDTGQSVRFGAKGFDHVPISKAIQASSALPGLFPPVEIDGRSYVDGALIKTLHASVALEEGVDLLLCINPIVPFDADLAAQCGNPRHHKLVEGGLAVVLSQTFRAIIHSRMQVGMSKYDNDYQGADVILFEPNRDDADMFFTNVFSYASRHKMCEHAYQTTRRDLLARKDTLAPIFKRHGITLRVDILEDETRHFFTTTFQQPAQLAHGLINSLDQLQHWVDKSLVR